MTMFQPFTCHECGGEVDYRSGPGRTYEYAKGQSIPIPDDFRLPACDSCGEQYFASDYGSFGQDGTGGSHVNQ